MGHLHFCCKDVGRQQKRFAMRVLQAERLVFIYDMLSCLCSYSTCQRYGFLMGILVWKVSQILTIQRGNPFHHLLICLICFWRRSCQKVIARSLAIIPSCYYEITKLVMQLHLNIIDLFKIKAENIISSGKYDMNQLHLKIGERVIGLYLTCSDLCNQPYNTSLHNYHEILIHPTPAYTLSFSG